jgi:hypothetical protein
MMGMYLLAYVLSKNLCSSQLYICADTGNDVSAGRSVMLERKLHLCRVVCFSDVLMNEEQMSSQIRLCWG